MEDRMADKLTRYRTMRDPERTPEPVPATGPLPTGNDDTFVIQEHHARRLHWDVRLERDGVLVSWAVPKGLPLDSTVNHLAVHTEDHPLEYASFEGQIPHGEYGGGAVILWDRGRYVLEKWTDTEVKVVFDGARAQGRYVFFRVRDRDWMVHRMDPPPSPDWTAVPVGLKPMLPAAGPLPADDKRWSYEMDWGGERALVGAESGRARVEVGTDDVTPLYPELRALGEWLGSRACLLDGVLVALDAHGRPSPTALRERRGASGARLRRVVTAHPVTYLVGDLLHLDGRDATPLPYRQRRELLNDLLPEGDNWHLSPVITGGEAALTASRDLGLRGVIAKRRDSPYRPGHRSEDWRAIDNRPVQQVHIGGWLPDETADLPGALLVGIETDDGLAYAGTVRTGLTAAAKAELAERLPRLARKTPPFRKDSMPDVDGAHWVRPSLTGRVSHVDWTRDGTLRRPTWQGLRG
jgi:bifunctional non-homologous end joining protein LigD